MFPIRDHNPSGRTPWVTWALLALNIGTFLATWPLFPSEDEAYWFFVDWGLVPASLMEGQGLGGLVTSMFLHAGWMHLIGNMLFLWIFGDNMEDAFGHWGFLVFYLASGLAAGFAQIAMDPWTVAPMVGASGAIAGVLGGYLLLFPKARVDVLLIIVIFFRIISVPAWIVLGAWMVLQVVGGFGTPADQGGVAYGAHAGGFIAGLILTLPFWLRQGGPAFWRRTAGSPPHPETQISRIPTVRRR